MNGAMRSMTFIMRSMALVLGAIAWACVVTWAQTSAPAVSAEQIQRGKYLVEHVAMCIQCHTPRTAQGALDHTRLFQGAPIPIPTPFPMQPWAFAAPKIAGLPGWTVDDAMRLLQTGIGARGYAPRPPMPPFRMTQADAAAVVAYLKSLP
jgi:mono/diheme cytochrome c family protein